MPPTWALNTVGHLLNSGPNSDSPFVLRMRALMGLLCFSCTQDYKEPPRSERMSHSERAEDRSDLQSTEAHISSDSEGNRGPKNALFLHSSCYFLSFLYCYCLFFSNGVCPVLVTVSLMRRHRSRFCPRQLHGAPALALVRPHKETHECLHGMGQG